MIASTLGVRERRPKVNRYLSHHRLLSFFIIGAALDTQIYRVYCGEERRNAIILGLVSVPPRVFPIMSNQDYGRLAGVGISHLRTAAFGHCQLPIQEGQTVAE